jgi:hypothetical protein
MDLPAPETLFRVANAVAALGWIALAVSPGQVRWAPTVRLAAGRVLPVAFAVVYVALLARFWTAEGGFGSIAAVQQLFAVPGLLAAGWLHYLAFDLFVGSWIAQRAADLRIPHVIVLALLVLCFMFGPAGLLAYAALRATFYRAPVLRAAGQAA